MREICVLMAVVAGVCAHAASPEAEARAAAWLEAWDRQGLHRTATAGDESGAAWLAREAEAIVGRAVTSESFALDRIDTVTAFLEIDGERIEGEPFLDAPPTDAEGIRGVASDTSARARLPCCRCRHPSSTDPISRRCAARAAIAHTSS